MKFSLKPLLGFCLIAGLFFSCKKNVQNAEESGIDSRRSGDTIIHKLNINGNMTIVKQINDEFYYADDILLSNEQFNSLKRMTLSNVGTIERSLIVRDFSQTWPNAKVYYRYPDKTLMTADEYTSFVNAINTALKQITDSTNIRFIERTTQPEYLKFVKHPSDNNSPLGWRKNMVNTINLVNYKTVGIIMHEVLHSLGVDHEQNRSDRDEYVIVDLSRVSPGQENNFNKTPGYEAYGPFDFNSIMLYGSRTFQKNPGPFYPLTKLDGTTFLGQRIVLSSGDVAGLKHLYFPIDINGTYRISPVYLDNKSLEVSGSSTVDGTSIVLNTTSDEPNQRFIIRRASDGTYQIKSQLDTTKVLTLNNVSASADTTVGLSTNKQTTSQKFSLLNRGNGGFSFKSSGFSNSSLEVSGGGSSDMTQIRATVFNENAEAQRFKLIKL